MAAITALFWDVGGVLLTNGWDHGERRRAVETFALERDEFEARHAEVAAAFETHEITSREYLDHTVFYRQRPFSPKDFQQFMFAQSQAHAETLRVAEHLASTRRYLMATLNNESLDLNLFRIRKFELRNHFSVFFSSCFLAARKPSVEIYRRALDLTQRAAGECVMIDDRPENLEAPRQLGMAAIQYQAPAQLREELERLGVVAQHAAG
jgi:putative hydrolase of the HAD superfamily